MINHYHIRKKKNIGVYTVLFNKICYEQSIKLIEISL